VFQSNLTKGTSNIIVVDQRMMNNTAEAEINVVYPYRLEVKLRDVTGRKRVSPLSDQELKDLDGSQTESFARQMFESPTEQEVD
jgi:hypothetical protein